MQGWGVPGTGGGGAGELGGNVLTTCTIAGVGNKMHRRAASVAGIDGSSLQLSADCDLCFCRWCCCCGTLALCAVV